MAESAPHQSSNPDHRRRPLVSTHELIRKCVRCQACELLEEHRVLREAGLRPRREACALHPSRLLRERTCPTKMRAGPRRIDPNKRRAARVTDSQIVYREFGARSAPEGLAALNTAKNFGSTNPSEIRPFRAAQSRPMSGRDGRFGGQDGVNDRRKDLPSHRRPRKTGPSSGAEGTRTPDPTLPVACPCSYASTAVHESVVEQELSSRLG